ncbi:DNA repair protein SWI5 homolog [Sturnira hondurensis]|uniref:DNA repair protein SWI5 homolog n=1 Tax=Sturnira hondurensis TaxID=192404 RepID=UPI0018799589|nr:DNA repair protein SWI5 homolog [Sturnira hondurensis]
MLTRLSPPPGGGARPRRVRAQLAVSLTVPGLLHRILIILVDLRGCSSAPTLDSPALRTPPIRGPRTPGLRRTQPGLSKSCRGAFRSPRPSSKSGQADGASEDSPHLDIQKLKEKRDLLDQEISQLISEGYSVDELEDHISQLHEYNDIKDVGQMLLGKLAVIRGVTTKELYPEFGLDMSD